MTSRRRGQAASRSSRRSRAQRWRLFASTAAMWPAGAIPAGGKTGGDVRYLYRYSVDELAEWVPRIHRIAAQTKEVSILFNNNSGGDAVGNAKQFMKMLGVDPTGLNPRQLELF